MNFDFQNHRVHNYKLLMRRWTAVVRKAKLDVQVYASADDSDLFCFRSRKLTRSGGIYLSAGIHGDEAAGPEGLYQWAGLHVGLLRELPFMIFPCLNPWGLIHNRRTDTENRDLNRSYHLDDLPRIRRQKEVLEGYRFRCAMCLHEDYDAQGVYLYEVRPAHEKAIGPELLAAAGYYVPVDLRKTIEGRRAEQGWISRAIRRKNYPLVPEALFLAFTHSERTITVETPSEYDIGARVLAQIAIIQRATELVAGEELSRLGKTISKTTA
ncbi:MAG: M14 family metallocarboxypeptidase [Verrucomicrobia bacterium]|nr:M14 family metallocarboxypeptidase [Verrucomicrobiota bacterium]MBV9674129.1 M14 family metallocarboxypeptidase [Verrucomicrobiota bacterium]